MAPIVTKRKRRRPAVGRRLELEERAFELSKRCPADCANPAECPLCGLRTMPARVRRAWIQKLSDKGTTSANKRVDPVRSQTQLPREEVISAFAAYFRSRYPTVDGALRPEELERATELMRTKFTDPSWTARVP